MDQGLRPPDDQTPIEDILSVRNRELSPEERGILADIYESLWSGVERDEIKSKMLNHKDLLDVEITLWVSDDGCYCTMAHFFEEHRIYVNSGKHQEDSIKKFASLIRDGLCHCQHCTASTRDIPSSSCLFRIAASIGEVWLMEFLLDQGCHSKSTSFLYDCSAVYLAMARSNYDVVKLLLHRASAQVNPLAEGSWTFLHDIAKVRCDCGLDVMKIAIGAFTCDVNAHDGLCGTALGRAVRNDNLEIVRFLLDNGADPNIRSKGFPLLYMAVMSGRTDMALALIKGGADVNAFSEGDGETALHYSIFSHVCFPYPSNCDDAEFSYVNHRNFSMCDDVDFEMAQLLLENGADLNLKNRDGNSPLVIAVELSCLKKVELLIPYGADVNVIGGEGLNVLQKAAWKGAKDIVSVLLASGAEPETLTSFNDTPLALAARDNHLNCLNILLKHKVDVDNADNNGDTPMHYLAYNGNVEGIQALLDHGANPDVLNRFNASPVWNAICMRHSEAVCLLVKQNVSLDINSCGNDHIGNDGIGARPLYTEPRSLLWVAVEREFMDGVKILLQAGYNIWKEGWLLYGEDQGLSEESLDISRYLRGLVQNPPSLLSLCRQIIRNGVSSDLEKTVQQFPVPVTLKDYLLLKNLKLQDSIARVSLWDFKYDPWS